MSNTYLHLNRSVQRRLNEIPASVKRILGLNEFFTGKCRFTLDRPFKDSMTATLYTAP